MLLIKNMGLEKDPKASLQSLITNEGKLVEVLHQARQSP